jgi:hypothetical protein
MIKFLVMVLRTITKNLKVFLQGFALHPKLLFKIL